MGKILKKYLPYSTGLLIGWLMALATPNVTFVDGLIFAGLAYLVLVCGHLAMIGFPDDN